MIPEENLHCVLSSVPDSILLTISHQRKLVGYFSLIFAISKDIIADLTQFPFSVLLYTIIQLTALIQLVCKIT